MDHDHILVFLQPLFDKFDSFSSFVSDFIFILFVVDLNVNSQNIVFILSLCLITFGWISSSMVLRFK